MGFPHFHGLRIPHFRRLRILPLYRLQVQSDVLDDDCNPLAVGRGQRYRHTFRKSSLCEGCWSKAGDEGQRRMGASFQFIYCRRQIYVFMWNARLSRMFVWELWRFATRGDMWIVMRLNNLCKYGY